MKAAEKMQHWPQTEQQLQQNYQLIDTHKIRKNIKMHVCINKNLPNVDQVE